MQLRYLFFIAAAFFLGGCTKFLDVTPKDEQTSSQLFSSKFGFYSAATGIYEEIASPDLYGRTMTYETMDILGKRYKLADTDPDAYFRFLSLQTYDVSRVSSRLSSLWGKAYKLILAGNFLIENIKEQKGVLTQDEADMLQGEMLTTRAFLHFDMLRLFGPRWENNAATLSIPYNDQSKVTVLPLLPFETVIEKIIHDLESAETLLAKDPVINKGPLASHAEGQSVQLRFRQFRFNYYSVIALKARVYLHAGKKAEALETAKRLLADPKIHQHFPPVDPNKLLFNHSDPDRVFSSEVLTGIYVKDRDNVFRDYFSSETAGNRFLQPYEQFLNRLFSFGGRNAPGSQEFADYRYQTQWDIAAAANAKGHEFAKYKSIIQPDSSEHFYSRMIPLIRLSEVYYIAAEAEPNPADGFAWLNQMRSRRGLTPIDPSQFNSLAGQFKTLLANEYLREFYGEGQAFFFFKRLAFRQHYENGSDFAFVDYSDATYRPPLPQGELK